MAVWLAIGLAERKAGLRVHQMVEMMAAKTAVMKDNHLVVYLVCL